MSDVSQARGSETEQEMSSATREPGAVLFGYALFGGITFWSIHLWVCAALTPAACAHGLTWLINVSTAVTAVGALGATLAGVRLRRYADGEGPHVGRTHLLSELAIIFGVASVALILLEGFPVLVLDPCSR